MADRASASDCDGNSASDEEAISDDDGFDGHSRYDYAGRWGGRRRVAVRDRRGKRRRRSELADVLLLAAAAAVVSSSETLARWEEEDRMQYQKVVSHRSSYAHDFYRLLWEREPLRFRAALRMSRETFEALHATLAPKEVEHGLPPDQRRWRPPGTLGAPAFTVRFSLALFLYTAGHAVTIATAADVFGVSEGTALSCTSALCHAFRTRRLNLPLAAVTPFVTALSASVCRLQQCCRSGQRYPDPGKRDQVAV